MKATGGSVGRKFAAARPTNSAQDPLSANVGSPLNTENALVALPVHTAPQWIEHLPPSTFRLSTVRGRSRCTLLLLEEQTALLSSKPLQN